MAHTIPEFLAVTISAKCKWLSVGSLLLCISACDRPSIPPHPGEPSRPKIMAAKQSPEVQRAIFTYARPVKKGGPVMMLETEDQKCCRLQV